MKRQLVILSIVLVGLLFFGCLGPAKTNGNGHTNQLNTGNSQSAQQQTQQQTQQQVNTDDVYFADANEKMVSSGTNGVTTNVNGKLAVDLKNKAWAFTLDDKSEAIAYVNGTEYEVKNLNGYCSENELKTTFEGSLTSGTEQTPGMFVLLELEKMKDPHSFNSMVEPMLKDNGDGTYTLDDTQDRMTFTLKKYGEHYLPTNVKYLYSSNPNGKLVYYFSYDISHKTYKDFNGFLNQELEYIKGCKNKNTQ